MKDDVLKVVVGVAVVLLVLFVVLPTLFAVVDFALTIVAAFVSVGIVAFLLWFLYEKFKN